MIELVTSLTKRIAAHLHRPSHYANGLSRCITVYFFSRLFSCSIILHAKKSLIPRAHERGWDDDARATADKVAMAGQTKRRQQRR